MIGLPELLVFLISLAVLAPASLVYFFPTVIAFRKHTGAAWWIAGLNLICGWTIIGWVVAFVWACKAVTADRSRAEPAQVSVPIDELRKPEA